MDHLIYKITNTENGKIYIGKTKKFYGEGKFGIEGRLKRHIGDALSEKREKKGCPKLCNAIKKYGQNKFIIEQLEETDADNIDEREEYYIKSYESTKDDIGYNIALGGKGRKVVYVDENVRGKISKGQEKSKSSEMNVIPYKDKKTGETIGYRARRRQQGVQYEKHFTSKKFTPEENRQKAIEFIQAIKNNAQNEYVKYNKEANLPKNISYIYDKNKVIGYKVCIARNKKTTKRSFQSKDEDLDELLKKAIKCKEDILKDMK